MRFDDIGNRLKAFPLGSGLPAKKWQAHRHFAHRALPLRKGRGGQNRDAGKAGRAACRCLLPTLLGVGVEYIASAVTYFERMRQIEETAEHIIVLAGPLSYLLASDAFNAVRGQILKRAFPTRLKTALARKPKSKRSWRC
jgi:hypothetical protein